jgi:hypothetical protein
VQALAVYYDLVIFRLPGSERRTNMRDMQSSRRARFLSQQSWDDLARFTRLAVCFLALAVVGSNHTFFLAFPSSLTLAEEEQPLLFEDIEPIEMQDADRDAFPSSSVTLPCEVFALVAALECEAASTCSFSITLHRSIRLQI